MKKSLAIFSFVLFSCDLLAQSIIPPGKGLMKFDDVVDFYKSNLQPQQEHGEHESDSRNFDLSRFMHSEQNKDYFIERWKWYWRQHLDDNGYIIPATRDYREWQKMQDVSKSKTDRTTAASVWTFQGPDSSGSFNASGLGAGIGRINTIAFHPTDTNIFWVGTPGGGAWRTNNNGASWACMTDGLPPVGVSAIVINPLNPNTVYLCTGDRDGGATSGIGILKSYNGGASWFIAPGMIWADSDYVTANSMLINPQDTNTLILATTTGIFVSHSGGNNWTEQKSGDFWQLLYKPGDTGIVYAASYGGWVYDSGWVYVNSEVFRSTNAGTTWNQTSSFVGTNRVTIAVTPANPSLLKVISSSGTSPNNNGYEGIYTSYDNGATFRRTDSGSCAHNLFYGYGGPGCGGQGSYTLPLAISPVNENELYTGGVNGWHSTDSGHNWILQTEWDTIVNGGVVTVHADKHTLAFNPLQPDKLYEVNDGGVFCAYHPASGGVWQDLTNRMGIGAFYRVGVSSIASFVMAGAQDVGVKVIHPGLYEEAGDTSDGMQCQLDPIDSAIGYFSFQFGSIYRIPVTDSFPMLSETNISMNIAGGSVDATGAWVTPFIIEPSCHTCLLAGYKKIYRTIDQGNSWTAISGAWATNPFSRIAVSLSDSNTIYAVESYGRNVFYTHNLGATWTAISDPMPTGNRSISDLRVDPLDSSHIWITIDGYGGNHVMQWYKNTGWSALDSALPDVPVLCFEIDYQSRDMYVGTDIGVFYRDTTMTSWQYFGTGLPAVQVTDLEINYGTQEIWAATYGRSLWKAPKHTNNLGISIIPCVADALTIMPNPNRGDFTVQFNNPVETPVDLLLYDLSGRTVWQQRNVPNTNSRLSVNIPDLKFGNYLLEVSNAKGVIGRQKVTVY